MPKALPISYVQETYLQKLNEQLVDYLFVETATVKGNIQDILKIYKITKLCLLILIVQEQSATMSISHNIIDLPKSYMLQLSIVR